MWFILTPEHSASRVRTETGVIRIRPNKRARYGITVTLPMAADLAAARAVSQAASPGQWSPGRSSLFPYLLLLSMPRHPSSLSSSHALSSTHRRKTLSRLLSAIPISTQKGLSCPRYTRYPASQPIPITSGPIQFPPTNPQAPYIYCFVAKFPLFALPPGVFSRVPRPPFQLFSLSFPFQHSVFSFSFLLSLHPPCGHCVAARTTAFGLIHSNDPYYLCHRSCYRGILLTINEVVDP